MKEKLDYLINDSKLATAIVQLLILLSAILVSIETIPELQQHMDLWHTIEYFFLFVFTVEYAIRIYVAPSKRKFIFSFYGIIDFLSLVPSVLSFGTVNMQFVRALRLLRIIRIIKLARYSKALDRIRDAILEIKEELLIFLFLSIITLYITAAGIYFFEHEAQPYVFKSIPHSLWWAVVTLTTVGYGDVYPITDGGKAFTILVLVVGLGIIAVPTGLLASAFANDGSKANREARNRVRQEDLE